MDIRNGLRLGGELFINHSNQSACLVSHKYPVNYREAKQIVVDLGLRETGKNKQGTIRYTYQDPPAQITEEQKQRMVMLSLEGEPIWALAHRYDISEDEVLSIIGLEAKIQELRALALDAQVASIQFSQEADYYEEKLRTMGNDEIQELEGISNGCGDNYF